MSKWIFDIVFWIYFEFYIWIEFSAAGLYYLAELVEEYTVVAGKVIRWIIIVKLISIHHFISITDFLFMFQCSLVIYLCLFLFEPLPLTMIICGVASHIMHILILKTFPYFALTSFPFISAVGKKFYLIWFLNCIY